MDVQHFPSTLSRRGTFFKESLALWRKRLRTISRTSIGWEILLASAALAVVMAILAYRAFQTAQTYAEFIPGPLAWLDASKSGDYFCLVVLLAGFFFSLLTTAGLAHRIKQNAGNGADAAYRNLLVYANLPAVLWLAGMLLASHQSTYSLSFAAVAACLVSRNAYWAARRIAPVSYDDFLDTVGSATLIPILGYFSGLAAVLGLTHLGVNISAKPQTCAGIAALVGWILLELSRTRSTNSTETQKAMPRNLLAAAQLPLPLIFLTLLPTSLDAAGRLGLHPAVTWAFLAFIAGVIGVSILDVLRRGQFLNRSGGSANARLWTAISPFSLIAIIILLKPVASGPGILAWDNYHLGEYLLPWWLTSEFGFIPYWDYMPSRGLVNYVPGLLASYFMDGTAKALHDVLPSLQLIYLIVVFLPIRRAVGMLPAFLIFLLMPLAGGMFEIHMLLAAGLCFLVTRLERLQACWWLTVWSLMCVALVLFAPAQGGGWAIATSPIALVALYRSRSEPARQWIGPGIVLGSAALLIAVTPAWKMILGAVRYVAELGSVNSVAFGIPWNASEATHHTLTEFLRTSFIAVPLLAGFVLLRGLKYQDSRRGRRMLTYAIPIGLLMVLFIPRAAGRIDPSGPSRLGIISVWAMCMLLPILLWSAVPKCRRGLAAAIVALAAGSLLPWFGMNDLKALAENRTGERAHLNLPIGHRTNPAAADAVMVDGEELPLPHLEAARISPAELKQLKSLKAALDDLLEPGETYLDLTNHSARHFYLRYPPPIEQAIYNLPTESQQLRAIERLEAISPPVVLAWTDDIYVHDGWMASVRSHLIYRYLIDRYKPVRIDGNVYLIHPSRWERVLHPQVDEMELIDRAFHQADFGQMPRSWGRSFESLKAKLHPVAKVSGNTPAEAVSMTDCGDGAFQVTGPNPELRFDLSGLGLAGKMAGILVFDLENRSADHPLVVEISWAGEDQVPHPNARVKFSGKGGRFVVPLDAMPRWLLCQDLKRLSIHVTGIPPESRISLQNVELFQRRAVDKLPGAVAEKNGI